ncbi:hypothetical protein LEP1GSC061_2315 [Leptospira wolffii serovar Khorat str. Khorat-H2]|nr:hypothetical protein LEP1GSC061_2315 [Leptospira wolffii serovar Khorat str. Khorat-H2]
MAISKVTQYFIPSTGARTLYFLSAIGIVLVAKPALEVAQEELKIKRAVKIVRAEIRVVIFSSFLRNRPRSRRGAHLEKTGTIQNEVRLLLSAMSVRKDIFSKKKTFQEENE